MGSQERKSINSYGLRVTRDYELKKNLDIYTLISHDI
jgi:hypothetical protein